MKFSYEVSRYKLIYVFGIPDAAHKGLLKIGDATISTDKKNLPPNCKELELAARKRIDDYTQNAGIAYKLLHTELAVDNNGKTFRDYDVHRLLKRHKVKIKGTKGKEWFRVDLDNIKRAIKAVKQRENFTPIDVHEEIIFRPEQNNAIERTVKYFRKKTNKDFLWNAKMRFGKTLCALEVVRQLNFAKTIIVTHRPVVKEGWFDDYDKIFHDDNYGSKTRGETLKTLLARKKNFVYFASIQDLRGSEKFNKNHDVFNANWDCVIVDEAHEGTQTDIGKKVLAELVKPETKILQLSGTPFNLIDDYTEENTFTWDYVMEQQAKADWDKKFFGDSNPYAELPKMNIYTYDLGKLLNVSYIDTFDKAFNFREFFRTNDKGNFVHEADIESFLDLLVKPDNNNYPFSRPEFCDMFRHTLWIVPGVKAGQALSKLLKEHIIFHNFEVANVAGEGDEDMPYKKALDLVKKTIAENEYTITISCGKLTAGVTVPQWTAVLYLAGSYSTSPINYLQTIFRVQNPCDKNGVSKQKCYVFDFAPDRTLKMVTEAADVSTRAGQTPDEHRQRLGEFLNFCPVIALEGSKMKPFDAGRLLQTIKSVYAARAVRNGFDDKNLYNDKLLKLNDADWKIFDKLKGIVGASDKPKPSAVKINKNDLDKEQRERDEDSTNKKSTRELTPEEREHLRQLQVRRNAISILRQVSIRMPLLIYGAEIDFDTDITIDKFANLVDDASWEEFMPKGVTKKIFAEFVQYYDPDIFVEAGRRVRQRAKAADELPPTERVKEIAELFATFKNPDKETVLTPWRVVNLHMSETFGGWNFFADNPPQFVPTEIFTPDKKILEINSKTGLYPLYVAYSIYRARLGETGEDKTDLDELQRLWDSTVNENVFVICKTPMAKTITRRTLLGYRAGTANAEYYSELITELKNIPSRFINRITEKNFWNKGAGKMFFDAVVGNPPYQNATANTSDEPVYNFFIDTSQKLSKHVSLIHPARCLFNAGKTPRDFNRRLLTNKNIRVVHYEQDSTIFFPTSDIKGGVVITEFDATKTFEPIGIFIPFDELISIHYKVCVDNENFCSLSKIIYPPESFHFTIKFHEDNPDSAKFLSDGHADDLTTNVFEKLPKIFFDDQPNDGHEYIQIYGLLKMQRVYRWIRRDYIRNETNLDKWKVIVPKSNGSGALGEVVSTPLVGSPLVGSPLVGSTQTFITVGAFDTEAEAQACLAYIKTKFCRVMLGILKVTQHNPPATWAKVPLQDFTANSDIDWSKPVAQIDAQLYRKYNLTADEINFIESHVKEMN